MSKSDKKNHATQLDLQVKPQPGEVDIKDAFIMARLYARREKSRSVQKP
jgi:hypothetical protein